MNHRCNQGTLLGQPKAWMPAAIDDPLKKDTGNVSVQKSSLGLYGIPSGRGEHPGWLEA